MLNLDAGSAGVKVSAVRAGTALRIRTADFTHNGEQRCSSGGYG
jgi:hypothetical protein